MGHEEPTRGPAERAPFPNYIELWKRGVALALIGVAAPWLAVLLPIILVNFILPDEASPALINLGWILGVGPFIVGAVTGVASLRAERFHHELAERGKGLFDTWWYGMRWLLLITILVVIGHYVIHAPVRAIAFSFGSPALKVTILLLGLVLLEFPAWGVLAHLLGFSARLRPVRSRPRAR